MGEVLPLPNRGEVFLDPRGEGRSLRVSWHRDRSTLVLSLWQLGQCRATFRLDTDEVPNLVRALVAGLADGLADHRELTRQLASQAERAAAPAAPENGPQPPRWYRSPVVQPDAQALAAPADPPTVPAGPELDVPAGPELDVPAGPELAEAMAAPIDAAAPPTVPVDPAVVADLPTVPAGPDTVAAKPEGELAIAVSDDPMVMKPADKPAPADVTGNHPQVTVAPAIFLAPPAPA
jgi:hypothetical protein